MIQVSSLKEETMRWNRKSVFLLISLTCQVICIRSIEKLTCLSSIRKGMSGNRLPHSALLNVMSGNLLSHSRLRKVMSGNLGWHSAMMNAMSENLGCHSAIVNEMSGNRESLSAIAEWHHRKGFGAKPNLFWTLVLRTPTNRKSLFSPKHFSLYWAGYEISDNFNETLSLLKNNSYTKWNLQKRPAGAGF